MDKVDYVLVFCFLLVAFSAVLELRRFIRKRERHDIFLFLLSVHICVCLIISYFTSFSVIVNLSIMGFAALIIVLVPWIFIRIRIKQ